MTTRRTVLASLPAALAASGVAAQERFPSRPVNVIVSLAPGNTVDVIARIYADRLSRSLGQSFVVSNRTGAGGAIAAGAVATSPPDGYTLLSGNSGHAILGVLSRNLPYDPIRDFSGIAMVGETPALVVVSPTLDVRTLADFVALARRRPGELNYGSAGNGSATHLAGAYFAASAGVELTHVPYRNGAEIISDMISGRVQAVFAPAAFTLPLLQAGRLTALAVAAPEGIEAPVRLPSARSAGTDYVYSTWYGFLAPARTPPAILERLGAAFEEASLDPELRASVAAQGVTTRVVTLAAFDAYIRGEMDRLGPVLRSLAGTLAN